MSKAFFKQYMKSLSNGGLPTTEDDEKVSSNEFNTNYQESQNYQRIVPRKGVRQNPDGSHSTHLMADNDKDEAWPTLFQDKKDNWIEPLNAYEMAKERGEIYQFDSRKELIDFARGGDWKGESGGDPSLSWSPSAQDLDPDYKPPIIQDDVTKVTVNDKGWADIDTYRKKKDDGQFIMNTQNFLIDQGFDIKNDALWGNKTYNTLNQHLVNKQLDNYQNTNFTEDQFLSQIWKESKGDKTVVSPKGAMGIAQFKPATFKELKDKGFLPETAKITDNASSILAQRRYMDQLYEGKITNSKSISSASTKEERQARSFAAYNWGPGNFDTFWANRTNKEKEGGWKTWYKKTNPETEKYVLWMMDKKKYKAENSTPYKHPKGYMTSKWNDVNYGYEQWKANNPTYRY